MNVNLRKLTEWTVYPWLLSLSMITYLCSLNLSSIRQGDWGTLNHDNQHN